MAGNSRQKTEKMAAKTKTVEESPDTMDDDGQKGPDWRNELHLLAARSNSKNTQNNSSSYWKNEQTLMYGQYRKDLGDFARRQAEKVKDRKKKETQKRKITFYDTSRYSIINILGQCERTKCSERISRYWDKVIDFVGGEDWLFLTLLGVSMAFISFLMDYTIEKCIEASRYVYEEAAFSKPLQFFVWIAFPTVLVCFSVGFTHIVGPNAIGSGIPEMKTILRGVVLKEYLNTRTFIAKVVGLSTALGSGLPIGKEGPFVHVASLAATFIGKGFRRFRGIYENESRFTEMLAAACAVGVACTFAAPIGGVLFSIEVTATYFAVRNYWRAFYASVVGAFIFRGLAIIFKDEETLTPFFPTSFRQEFPFDPIELLAFALLGVLCGCSGALFVFLHRRIVLFMRNQKKLSGFLQKNRFIFPTVIVVIVMGLLCPLGLGQFMAGEATNMRAIKDFFSNQTWTGADMESGVDQATLKMWEGKSGSIYVSLALFGFIRLILTALAITIPFPSGVFAPAFAMGASFGRLTGECMAAWFPLGIGGKIIVPGGYAVVGAAAMSGAVTHTVSTAMIAFEMTGQISYALPCIIAVLVANAVAYKLEVSIYDSVIGLKKLPFLPDITSAKAVNAYGICVEDFMVREVSFIPLEVTYYDVFRILKSSSYRAYPLVDCEESMILLGSIQRFELERMIIKQLATNPDGLLGTEPVVAPSRQFTKQNESKSDDDSDEPSTPEDNELPPGVKKKTRFAVQKVDEKEIRASRKATPKDAPLRDIELKDMTLNPAMARVQRSVSDSGSFRKKVGFVMTNPPMAPDGNDQPSDEDKFDKELAKFPIRVDDIELEDLLDWEMTLLEEYANFEGCRIDPAPFQLVERTSLYRVHSIFSLLNLHHCYVTNTGRLMGIVAMKEVRNAVEGHLNKTAGKQVERQMSFDNELQHSRRTEENSTTIVMDEHNTFGTSTET